MTLIGSKFVDLKFQYLGHRDYVHGSSMLEGMLKSVSLFLGYRISSGSKIKSFRIIKEFNFHARAVSMRTEDCHNYPLLDKATARLDIEIDRERYTSLLIPEPAQKVTDRLSSYDAGVYVESIKIFNDGMSCAKLLNMNNLIDLMRGIVEANRQITIKEYISKDFVKMRWGYVTDFQIPSEEEIRRVKSVKFSPRFVMSKNDHIFALKKVHIDDLGDVFNFDICFFIQSLPK